MEVFSTFRLFNFLAVAALLLPVLACRPGELPGPEKSPLQPLGFSIQAGAFSDFNNALRLTEILRNRGLDAFFFVSDTGLYKVRLGNFNSRSQAAAKARALKNSGVLDEYYIVRPQQHPEDKFGRSSLERIRENLVKTAKGFIGIPYEWSGESSKEGFDCSGLTMAVYRLNGFDMPRTVDQQWEMGRYVAGDRISEGDLVFFSTKGTGETSHVGIYAGEGDFIHSPSAGKVVSVDSLSNSYFKEHFRGARTYL